MLYDIIVYHGDFCVDKMLFVILIDSDGQKISQNMLLLLKRTPFVLTVRKLCDKTAEITVWDAQPCLSATHRQEDGSWSRGVGA